MAIQVSPGVNVSEIDLTTTIPPVSTTVGGIAGVFPWGPIGEATLVTSETDLVNKFGAPTSLNPETFMTASSFLAYSPALFVSRAANTTNTAVAAFNAVANVSTANVSNCVVKSATDYYANGVTGKPLDPNALFVARYPGAIGDSLQISICDSTNAYSSTVNLMSSNATVAVNGSINIAIGSNSALLSFTANTTAADANTYATTVKSALTNGDIVTVGNSTIGTQNLQINSITQTSNATGGYITLGFTSNYLKSTAFAANTTVNGNSSVVTLTRGWQYAGLVSAPTTSQWVQQYGNTSAIDTMSVVIADQGGLFTGVQGQVLEVYNNVSRAVDAQNTNGTPNYYKTVINQNSKYVWFANDRSGAASANSNVLASSTNQAPATLRMVGGTDGSNESSMGTNQFVDLANAYDLYKDTTIPVSLLMQGKPVGGSSGTYNNFQLANYLIDNIATVRKDLVVFITPDDQVVVQNQTNIAQSLVGWAGTVHDTTYAVMDSGYKYMYDRYNDVYRYVPSNGDVAGLCARTDQTNDPWWSPAGFNRGQIKNIVKLRWNPTQADRDILYPNAINPLVTFPGQGTILYGDKTANPAPSAFSNINVRRLFIVLEKAISIASRYYLFEFNDAFTRSQFVNLITPYLRTVQGRRGITDFSVVCNESNNPPAVIDANQFVGDIYIKPNRSINYIQLNFVAVPTGVQFNTIVSG
jgi:hypothetical protein